jgi:membrane-associated phospholipid phosphatase
MAWVSCAAAFSWQRIAGRLAAVLVWLLVAAYGLTVFWGRMAAGAHYLTDCLFSAGCTLLLGALLFRLLEKKLTGRS